MWWMYSYLCFWSPWFIPVPPVQHSTEPWWEVLRVSQYASTGTVKAAYRKVAKATHPDSAPDGAGDIEKFRKATEAYRTFQQRLQNKPRARAA